jgi:hypothetical protein
LIESTVEEYPRSPLANSFGEMKIWRIHFWQDYF